MAQDVDTAADAASSENLAIAVDRGVRASAQDHGAAFRGSRRGLNLAAVAQRCGKDAYRITLQLAQVAHLVSGCLHQQRNAFDSAPGDFHLLARG